MPHVPPVPTSMSAARTVFSLAISEIGQPLQFSRNLEKCPESVTLLSIDG